MPRSTRSNAGSMVTILGKESIIRGLAWHSVSNIDTTQNAKQGEI